jgi:hypothetical protein
MEVEREIDRLLCAALGVAGVDAARVGARRQRIESWALLLTGLSAAELMRAKRLRDAGRLQREDLVCLLSVIDEMAAEDDSSGGSSAALCEKRQELWDRLAVVPGLEAPAQSNPVVYGEAMEQPFTVLGTAAEESRPAAASDTLSYAYAFVVQGVPVWDGTTQTGELPLPGAGRQSPSFSGDPKGRMAVVTVDAPATNATALHVQKGDVVELVSVASAHWWTVRLGDRQGFVSPTVLQVVVDDAPLVGAE